VSEDWLLASLKLTFPVKPTRKNPEGVDLYADNEYNGPVSVQMYVLRVTRFACEKIAQNVAQTMFCRI
jgi:hypothetical protein